MLNLTLPNFAFVVAFAVKGLGWQASTVGVMAALPHLCNCLQPALLAGLSRKLSTYHILVLTFAAGSVPWLLALSYPYLGAARDGFFAAGLIMATLANSVSSVAWSSAISEVVPERLTSRYFARRNLIFGGWTLVAVLAAGHIAEWFDNSLTAFGWIFFFAGLSRLAGLFFLSRMRFPVIVTQKRSRVIAFEDLAAVFRNANYLWLCVFVGGWGLVLNLAMPFYTVFLVRELDFGVGDVVMFTTLSSLGGLLTLKGWGKLSERFGNRPTLQVCAFIWGLAALLIWSFARPGMTWHLYLGYLAIGATTAGFQLMQFNLMVRLAPPALRPAYVAVFLALTSLFTAAGPILGGQLLRLVPLSLGTFFGLPITSYHVLFILSGCGCLLMSNVVRRVREPAEAEVISVWREMRTMRTFNPMLSVLAVGELLLTPRGLFALARQSWRTARQQAKALEEVGGEIVTGSLEALGGSTGLLKPGVPAEKENREREK